MQRSIDRKDHKALSAEEMFAGLAQEEWRPAGLDLRREQGRPQGVVVERCAMSGSWATANAPASVCRQLLRLSEHSSRQFGPPTRAP